MPAPEPFCFFFSSAAQLRRVHRFPVGDPNCGANLILLAQVNSGFEDPFCSGSVASDTSFAKRAVGVSATVAASSGTLAGRSIKLPITWVHHVTLAPGPGLGRRPHNRRTSQS